MGNQNETNIAELIGSYGAEFRGYQQGPRGVLVMFTDSMTRTTLVLAEPDFSAENLSRRLHESREAYRNASQQM